MDGGGEKDKEDLSKLSYTLDTTFQAWYLDKIIHR